MDLLSIGIGFALGVIVYTIVIYIMVKKIKNKKFKKFLEESKKIKGEEDGQFNVTKKNS